MLVNHDCEQSYANSLLRFSLIHAPGIKPIIYVLFFLGFGFVFLLFSYLLKVISNLTNSVQAIEYIQPITRTKKFGFTELSKQGK